MTEFLIHHVERTLAPEGWRRHRAIRQSGLAQGSDQKYDFTTLFYQAVRCGSDVILISPKLLNFRKLFQRTRFSVEGVSARISIASYYRHAIITLRGLPAGPKLHIKFPNGERAEAEIQYSQLDLFSGLNCEMSINKNNDLDWIRDRLRFHVRHRGLEALAFVDNGSDVYSLEDIQAVLSEVGLKKALILSMPFPWGGMNLKPRARELFLQTSAYNLLRVKYLQLARAVLRMDIDEVLAKAPQGTTVFDAAAAPGPGFVIFRGVNLVRHPESDGKPQFRDHIYSKSVPSGSTNWCINPRGVLGRFQWRCHNVERNIFDRFHHDPRFTYYHCLGLTTGWKDKGRLKTDQNVVPHPEAKAFFENEMIPDAS